MYFQEKNRPSPVYQLTRYTFTGQYASLDDPTTSASEGFGLTCTRQGMFYNARWLDPVTGRFAQADSIVHGGARGLDRYAYVNNNPLRFTDPSGHRCVPVEECKGFNSGGGGGRSIRFDESINIFLAGAQNGDAIVTTINRERVEFVYYIDPSGRLLMWNMSEGKPYEGYSVLKYLSENKIPIAFWEFQSDGTYGILGISNFPNSNGNFQDIPYPAIASYAAQIGMQQGTPSSGSSLPSGYENGFIYFQRSRSVDPIATGLTLVGLSSPVVEKIGPWTVPAALGRGIGVLTVSYGISTFYSWWHNWEITDIVVNPGLSSLPSYNP